MIDYILRFPDKKAAQTALPDWLYTDQDTGKSEWVPKDHTGITEVQVITQPAIWDESEPPVLTHAQEFASGFWLFISCDEPDFYNQDFVVAQGDGTNIIKTKFTDEQMAKLHSVSGLFAGRQYTF